MTNHSNNEHPPTNRDHQPDRPQAPHPAEQQQAASVHPQAVTGTPTPPQQGTHVPVHQAPRDFVTPESGAGQSLPPTAHQHNMHQGHPSQGQNPANPENAPDQPQKFLKAKRKPNRAIKWMQLVMSLTFFAAIGLAGFVIFTNQEIDKPGPLAEATVFEVGKGQGLSVISSRLQKEGIVRNKRLFAMNAITRKAAKKLKAGKYSIPPGASIQKVLDILVKGKAIFYKVTIPEGWTSEQAVNALNAHPQLMGSISTIPPEGSLMPDTFQFSEGATRQKILETMAVSQKKYLAGLWENRQQDLPLKTPQEALILASIVEKETGRASERKRVAGVFINRLRKGMKLQSDPTIIYGLVGGKGKLGHPLRRSEMNKKTGYNTYQISGLPPTPIANPGRHAIEAVLNPADTKDLFFVADGTGGHAFAPTMKQHNKNVRKWRKIEAERRREQKRKKAEQQRLAALEKNNNPPPKIVEISQPGIAVSQPVPTLAKTKNGWDNTIPLPTRKPRK